MENIVLYDWVSITSKIHTPSEIISLLGLENVPWDTVKGAHGYLDRYYWNCISIHFNGSPEMGVWLELSGQGCRAFESVGHGDYDFLFQLVKDNPNDMKITRLDIAFDDHTGILDMPILISDTLVGNYVSKANSWEVVQSNKGTCVVIGSRQSPVLIRIYDKAAERNIVDGSHWIRVELQLRDSRCLEFVLQPYDVGETFAGVILNYLRYVVPDLSDTNKWRWSLTDYWADLVGSACAISIYKKPGLEYNLSNCEDYVYKQAGNAINALLQIYDVETFLVKLRSRKVRMNPKYKQLVDKYKVVVSNEEQQHAPSDGAAVPCPANV